jgi:hypothetical protein
MRPPMSPGSRAVGGRIRAQPKIFLSTPKLPSSQRRSESMEARACDAPRRRTALWACGLVGLVGRRGRIGPARFIRSTPNRAGSEIARGRRAFASLRRSPLPRFRWMSPSLRLHVCTFARLHVHAFFRRAGASGSSSLEVTARRPSRASEERAKNWAAPRRRRGKRAAVRQTIWEPGTRPKDGLLSHRTYVGPHRTTGHAPRHRVALTSPWHHP